MTTVQLLFVCLIAVSANVFADTCPGGRVRCPDFMTCCHISDNDFGCCPFPDAKCCLDRIHCCPHNMDCDVRHQSCIRNGSDFQFSWQVPIQPEIIESVVPEVELREDNHLTQLKDSANMCPDESECHSSFTCCKMYSGKYGCCPFDNGTCCKDGFHCCPHGSQCLPSGDCQNKEMNYTLSAYPLKDKKYEKLIKTFGKPRHQDVSDPGGVCPDGHPCPEKYTCCKISGERYGCCPITDAVCCDDGIHCCPKGTTCNTTLGTCDIQKNFGLSIPVQHQVKVQRQESLKIEDEVPESTHGVIVGDVVCPDERYRCPSGTTCCQLSSGAYGCCPLERATCCSDKEHCCPHGYTCDGGDCRRGSARLPPFLQTTPAVFSSEEQNQEVEKSSTTGVEEPVSAVICPDDYPCPDRNTCCQLASGEYGCCPMEKATCCDDKIHCCPHGYRCVNEGCQKETGPYLSPAFINAISIKRKPKDVKPAAAEDTVKDDVNGVCPDEKSDCPDGTTCCELEGGGYGCCFYENATCCGDKIHCCPHGYWCSDDGCDRMPGMPSHYAPFLLRLSSARKVSAEGEVTLSEFLP